MDSELRVPRPARYMTVSVAFSPIGVNLNCWMSTEENFMISRRGFPYEYTYGGNDCDWFIHSNLELTSKVISAVGEYAESILRDQIARNLKRKLSNR